MMLSAIRRRWRAPGGYRQVLSMAVPLILSTGSWSLQGFINRMFLVWHSPESLAAAMPAGMVNFAILSLFIATAGYVSTFVAQYHGSGQDDKVGGILWQSVPIALFAGLLNLALVPAARFSSRGWAMSRPSRRKKSPCSGSCASARFPWSWVPPSPERSRAWGGHGRSW